jgi:hypothetical protein
MLLRRRMAALFVVLPLAGCASVAAGPGQAPNAKRSSRHQRNALTGGPDSEPQIGTRAAVPIDARTAAGFSPPITRQSRSASMCCMCDHQHHIDRTAAGLHEKDISAERITKSRWA